MLCLAVGWASFGGGNAGKGGEDGIGPWARGDRRTVDVGDNDVALMGRCATGKLCSGSVDDCSEARTISS